MLIDTPAKPIVSNAMLVRLSLWASLVVMMVGAIAATMSSAGLWWDFANYYDAGHKASAGEYQSLYDHTARIQGQPPLSKMPFRSAPISAFFYAPLAAASPRTALYIFKAFNTISWFTGLLLLYLQMRPYAERRHLFAPLFAVAALLFQPIWSVYRVGGQTTPVVFLLLVAALTTFLAERYKTCAVCVVLSCVIKPLFLPLALALLIFSPRRAGFWTALFGAASLALGTLAMGWEVHVEFIRKVLLTTSNPFDWTYSSALTLVVDNFRVLGNWRPPFPANLRLLMAGATLLRLAVFVGLLTVAWKVPRNRLLSAEARRHFQFVVAIVATLCVPPVLWEHYLSLLFIPFAFFLARWKWFSRGAQVLIALAFATAMWQNIILVQTLVRTVPLGWVTAVVAGLLKSAPLWLLAALVVCYRNQIADAHQAPAETCIVPDESTETCGAPAWIINRWIRILGLMNLLAYTALTVISYGLLGAAIDGPEANEHAFLDMLAERLSFAGPAVQAYVRGEVLTLSSGRMFAAYVLPQLIPAASFVLLLFLLFRNRRKLTQTTSALLTRWSIVFCALSIPAFPVLVQDFWLSPAWGRMMVAGQNPYLESITPSAVAGIPLDMVGQKMTYGPLWAVLSEVVMALAGQSALWAGLLFKLLLAAAWVGQLLVVGRLLEKHGPWLQCIGIAIAGWLPLSVHQTVAEGHNDILMVLCLVLWLWELERGHATRAALFLGASVLFKYVTAPLFLLHLLHEKRARGRTWFQSVLTTLPAMGFVVAVAALILRSVDALLNSWQMTHWHVYEPPHAMFHLLHLAGLSWLPLVKPVRLLFPVIAVFLVVRYWLAPTTARLYSAAAGILTVILCSMVGHIWPWFLMWPLSLAALGPSSRLTRWVIGLSFAATASFPLVIARLTPPGTRHRFDAPSIVFHLIALLWLVTVPRYWLGKKSGARDIDVSRSA